MSDMRDDLDELGRRLWPTTDALRPADGAAAPSRQGLGRRFWRFEPLVTVAAAVLLVGVIGGAVVLGRSLATPTPVPAAPSTSQPVATVGPSTPSPSTSQSPTALPAPHVIVWATGTPSDTVIRVGTASGGFRTVATIPASADAAILGAGGHRVLFWEVTDGHLYEADIDTGLITDYGGASRDRFYGAAFSPDGSQVEYVQWTSSPNAQLLRLDFGSGVITLLQNYGSGVADVPEVWSGAGVAASRRHLPTLDSPEPGFAILDPSTGSRIATTDSPMRSWAIAADGVHAAFGVSSPPDTPVSPGALSTVVIGSPPKVAIQENSNHFIQVHGISPDGSTVLFSDEPTMGGYAGITLSPDYGLFTFSAGRRSQVAHFSGSNAGYVGAAYINNSDFVIVDETAAPAGTKATLLYSSAGGPLTPLDTSPGSTTAVYVVTG
jgi:hypothetical protein